MKMAALSSELSPPNLVLRIRISDLSCISFCFEEHVSDYWFAQNPSSYKEGGCAFSWLVDNRRIGSFIRILDLSDLIIQRLPQDHFLRDYFPRDRNVCLYPWYYVLWFLEKVFFNRQLPGIIKKKIIMKNDCYYHFLNIHYCAWQRPFTLSGCQDWKHHAHIFYFS